MKTSEANSDLDLTINRVIAAPRQTVWDAWADPRSLEKWWLPGPATCRVLDLDLRAGGAFRTEMSEDGREYQPHLDACFLDVEEGRRIVFTTAVDSRWRPAEDGLLISAAITLEEHPEGTSYNALVMHSTRAERDRHDELGFEEGWGTAIRQLGELVEPGA